jgi:carbon monoxide dehydrogenase subunit G
LRQNTHFDREGESKMEMSGEQLIPVPQARVWAGLNDPEVLKASIPGCESIERVSDTEYKVVITAAVGPVKAKFNGKLLLADVNAPTSYRLAFEGSGGAAGFGKGGAQVSLAPDGAGTRLSYLANAQVGGKLAQVGSRLIDGVAKKMADDFFQRFNAKLAGPAPAPVATAGGAMATAQGVWLTPTYAFIATFVVALAIIWLAA